MATKGFRVSEKFRAWSAVGGYDDLGKMDMHREAKRAMKALATALGLSKGDYDLRSNLSGTASSGEVTLHTDRLYVQVQVPVGMGPGVEILYRACKSRKDFSGEMNHFAPVEALDEPQAFAGKLKAFMVRRYPDMRAAS